MEVSQFKVNKTIYSKLHNNVIKMNDSTSGDLEPKYNSLVGKSGRIRPETANVYEK